jgi:adenylylsulfate kinase
MNENITWHSGSIKKEDREKLLNQKGEVIWFTGLSGSGKSTIAVELEKELFSKGRLVYRLDGDNIRHGLNNDLGFSNDERKENIRRIAEVAKLMQDAGLIVLASFITPFKKTRETIKDIVGENNLKISDYATKVLAACIITIGLYFSFY